MAETSKPELSLLESGPTPAPENGPSPGPRPHHLPPSSHSSMHVLEGAVVFFKHLG